MAGSKIIIAGGGMVAGYAARQFVELGLKSGDLTIVSADTTVPYERPPLSKAFLAGKDTADGILINPESFYPDHGIDVRLGNAIVAVDTARKCLRLASGELTYETLIIATGAVARRLDLPGADLASIFYLRSMADSKRIREAAASAKQAAVIGGGFIGMEVAAVLAQKSIEVTMIVGEDRIWKRLFTPQISEFFEKYYASHGVRLVKNASLKKFEGDGAVRSVVLKDGASIPCQMVVAGVGAQTAIGFLAGSGVELGDGVMVNEYLETNLLGVLAAGDIANYPDVLFAKRRRAEHWDNAVSQGQHCAASVMSQRAIFRHVPYFFSDVFDLSYEFWGDAAGADQVIDRGDFSSGSFSVWWLREGRIIAAFIMNRPAEERDAAPGWIESRQTVSAARLAEASRPVTEAAA